ncbi:MAG: glycosyltransferase family 4 protein [Duncaniella sp.]|nr:glycosyltransferase family 4 protein [Duncaniella sp.]
MLAKILIFSQHPRGTSGGGILRYCNELQRLFQNDKDFDIQLIEEMPYPHKFWVAKYNSKELEETIAQSGCDIVHVNGFVTLGISQVINTAKRLNKKVVYTPHWHPFGTLRRPFLGKCFFKIMLESKIKHKVDRIITFNNEDSAFFKKLNGKVSKIPHWANSLATQRDIKKNANQILFVGGRLNDGNKGIEHIFSIPYRKYNIHIVGNGNVTLRDDMTLHSDITDDELFELYSQSSLVVVPSRYESFSYVSLESLCCGTPIVISDRVRIGDYLKDCPSCRIFKYHDFNDFNDAINDTIGNNNKTIDYLNQFSLQKAKEAYRELYQTVLSR